MQKCTATYRFKRGNLMSSLALLGARLRRLAPRNVIDWTFCETIMLTMGLFVGFKERERGGEIESEFKI